MNWLGHLLVLPDQGLVTLGNLLGDFIKGRVDKIEPRDLRIGVALHRELDRYTDDHPAVLRSKALISPQRRRIAGILVDVFYDHFLAQGLDVDSFRPGLLEHAHSLPEALRPLPARMITSSWLGSYSTVEGIGYVLSRMEQRRKRIIGLDGAESELSQHYEALSRDVRDFYPDVARFTKEALHRLRSASPEEPRADGAEESSLDHLRIV
ncbi:MAG: ACP phosphodiesterase [Chloroflexia bacterium]